MYHPGCVAEEVRKEEETEECLMPFRSEKQRKYLYAKHPKIAKRWTKKHGSKIVKKKKTRKKH